jgi:uncharacterized membrane protein
MTPKITKSNIVEIIALLWLIAAQLTDGWLGVAFAAMAVENTAESIYYSFKESQTRAKATKGKS